MTLGEYVRNWREENGITQVELAKEIGLPGSNSDICRLENGTERCLDSLRSRLLYRIVSGYARSFIAIDVIVKVDDLNAEEKSCLLMFIVKL